MFVRTRCCSSCSVVVLVVAVAGSSRSSCLIVAAGRDRRQRQVPARARTRPTSTCATASATTLSTLQEGIAGVRVIQAFGREDVRGRALRRDATRRSTTPTCDDGADLGAGTSRSSSSPASATTRSIVGVGGWLVAPATSSRSARSPPSCCYLDQPVRAGAAAQPAVQHRAVGRRRAATSCSACSTPPSTSPSGRAPSTCPPTGAIEVDDVVVRVRRRPTPVLARRRRSTIAPGERLALVGPDRRRQVDAGQADRPPLRPDRGRGHASAASTCATRRCASLRERIVVVPQEGFLFDGTIRDNVRIGRAGRHRRRGRRRARRASASRERFAALPEGLDTEVRERGLAAVGRREAARVAGPGRAGRPGGARARRGDVEPRPRHRGRSSSAALERADGGPHRRRRRPPPVDRRAGRPGRRGRRRPARRARHPRRARRPPRRPLYADMYASWAVAGSPPRDRGAGTPSKTPVCAPNLEESDADRNVDEGDDTSARSR